MARLLCSISRVVKRVCLEEDEHLLGGVVVPVGDGLGREEVLHPLPLLQKVVQVLDAALRSLAQDVVSELKNEGKKNLKCTNNYLTLSPVTNKGPT